MSWETGQHAHYQAVVCNAAHLGVFIGGHRDDAVKNHTWAHVLVTQRVTQGERARGAAAMVTIARSYHAVQGGFGWARSR